jgi:hypothetical protein
LSSDFQDEVSTMANAQMLMADQSISPSDEAALIIVEQQKLSPTLQEYVRTLEKAPFIRDIKHDREHIIFELPKLWPDQSSQARALFTIIDAAVQAIPALDMRSSIFLRVEVAPTLIGPSPSPDPNGATVVLTFDGIDGLFRKYTVPALETPPHLGGMSIPGGVVVTCQAMPPLFNVLEDNRLRGVGVGAVYGAPRTRDRLMSADEEVEAARASTPMFPPPHADEHHATNHPPYPHPSFEAEGELEGERSRMSGVGAAAAHGGGEEISGAMVLGAEAGVAIGAVVGGIADAVRGEHNALSEVSESGERAMRAEDAAVGRAEIEEAEVVSRESTQLTAQITEEVAELAHEVAIAEAEVTASSEHETVLTGHPNRPETAYEGALQHEAVHEGVGHEHGSLSEHQILAGEHVSLREAEHIVSYELPYEHGMEVMAHDRHSAHAGGAEVNRAGVGGHDRVAHHEIVGHNGTEAHAEAPHEVPHVDGAGHRTETETLPAEPFKEGRGAPRDRFEITGASDGGGGEELARDALHAEHEARREAEREQGNTSFRDVKDEVDRVKEHMPEFESYNFDHTPYGQGYQFVHGGSPAHAMEGRVLGLGAGGRAQRIAAGQSIFSVRAARAFNAIPRPLSGRLLASSVAYSPAWVSASNVSLAAKPEKFIQMSGRSSSTREWPAATSAAVPYGNLVASNGLNRSIKISGGRAGVLPMMGLGAMIATSSPKIAGEEKRLGQLWISRSRSLVTNEQEFLKDRMKSEKMKIQATLACAEEMPAQAPVADELIPSP